jgi:hypothetical protein
MCDRLQLRLLSKLITFTFEKSSTFASQEDDDQGCQMDYFHTKHPNFGIFWKVLEYNFWYILRPFDIPILWTFSKLSGN